MGCAKRAIEDHIESCRDNLEPEFMEAYAVEFVKWLYSLDYKITESLTMDQALEQFIEIEKSQEFWEFCADDMNGGD